MLLETGVILLHFGFQAKFASLLSLVTKKSRQFLSLSNSDHMKLTKKIKCAKQPSVCIMILIFTLLAPS